jgi:hypothetical protein
LYSGTEIAAAVRPGSLLPGQSSVRNDDLGGVAIIIAATIAGSKFGQQVRRQRHPAGLGLADYGRDLLLRK